MKKSFLLLTIRNIILVALLLLPQWTIAQTVDATGTFDPVTGNAIVYASLVFTDTDSDGTFDATFVLSENAIAAWGDYSAAIAFYTSRIEVRNGGSFSGTNTANTVPVVPGTVYHTWINLDVASKKYSAWIKTDDMPEPVLLFQNAAFRNSAITAIQRWSALHNPSGEPDIVTVNKVEMVDAVGKIPGVYTNHALSLPGGSNGANSNIAIAALNITSLPVTVEMWYKPEATQNYYATVWYNRGTTNNSGVQYDRWVDATKIKGVWNGTSELPATKPVAGAWNHVALVVTQNSKTLYINGTPFTETGTSFANFAFDGITYLGWDKAGADRTLKGLIDEVKIWSKARTAEEINGDKYKSLKGNETNLIGYWNFDDENPTRITDMSAASRHGTNTGGTYVDSDVFDQMTYENSECSQASTDEVINNSKDNPIIKLVINTSKQSNPLSLKSLQLTSHGSTNIADISNVTVYYTTSNQFSTATKFGNIVPTQTNFTVTGNQLLTTGANYFWVTYDIANNAAQNNMADGECTGFQLQSSATFELTPTTSNLSGARKILSDISGNLNFAMLLPGGNGATSNITLPPMNITTMPVTIEMWYKPDALQNDYSTLLSSRTSDGANSKIVGIQYDKNVDPTKLKAVWDSPSTETLTPEKPIPGQWNHVAIVLTSTTKTIYVNGIPFEYPAATFTTHNFSTVNSYLGWDNIYWRTDLPNRTYKGVVDEVRIWNTARTTQQIESSRMSKLIGNEPGLVGYWNFDDRSATAIDKTTNGYHGTIYGGQYVLSTVFEPMKHASSTTYQKDTKAIQGTADNVVMCLKINTIDQLNPLRLKTLNLAATGTIQLSDITNVKVYASGADSVFKTTTLFAQTGNTPANNNFSLNGNYTLGTGNNFFWITCDLNENITPGNVVDMVCNSIVIEGTELTTHIPAITSPAGGLVVNPGSLINHKKLPVDIVTTKAATPLLGANFVSFQQNAIMTYNGYQYITYWNNNFRVCIARKKLSAAIWEVLEFSDHTVTESRVADGHYSISMGICANDGTIHIAFDHHGDVFHYKKSVADLANTPEKIVWNETSFSPKQSYLIPGQTINLVTYPRFVSKPNGDLIYECRIGTSGAGDSYLWEYSAQTGSWNSIGKYIDGISLNPDQNAYINGIHYDQNGRMHVSWVWRETPDPLTNHDVHYAYSENDGRTWKNAQGTEIGTAGTNPMSLNTTGLKIWTINKNRGLINQESQAVDSKGRIHILQTYMPANEPNSTNFWGDRERAGYLHHIYQDDAGVWRSDRIEAVSRNRCEIAVDASDNLYIVAPNYRVLFASAANKWQNWTEMDLSESASAINEGLIDREALLTENVLSFVFAQNVGKIIVPYYLLENSKPAYGEGLSITAFKGTEWNDTLTQKLDAVIITSGDIPGNGTQIGIRCSGILETKYAQSYNLYLTTSGNTKMWINDNLVVNTGNLATATEFTTTLSLIPTHKYRIRIEGTFTRSNTALKLEWSAKSQDRQIVPITALYGELSSFENKLSNDANLSELTVNTGTLTPAFHPLQYTYSVLVPEGTTSATVSATANHTAAIVTGNGIVDLTGGKGSANFTITAEDGITTKTYSVTILVNKFELKHSYTFEDGTATDVKGNANGTLNGGTIQNGIYTTKTNGEYITLPAATIGINTYPTITLEGYITAGDASNPNYTMLSYFGNTSAQGFGSDGYFISIARGDNRSRTAISCGNDASPWSSESGVDGLELEDGAKHHLVSILSLSTITWYIDGVKIAETELTGNNQITNLSNNLAYLCKGGYSADPTWLGSIHEFNIYSGVMAPETIQQNANTFLALDPLSNDATLASLGTSTGTITPTFHPSITTYAVNVPEGTTSVVVNATANHPKATISGTGSMDISMGSKTANILVTAEDGITKQSYTVEIIVKTGVASKQSGLIKVYPTISSGAFIVSLPSVKGEITVFDTTGKLVIKRSLTHPSEVLEVNKPGIYMISVECDGIQHSQRIIKVN